MNDVASSTAIPEAFLARLKRIVPENRLSAMLTHVTSPVTQTSFRINPLVQSVVETLDQLGTLGMAVQTVPWCEEARCIAPSDRERLTHSPLAENGTVYVQGLSSILATHVLDPQPDEQVLDLAAAPGGKAAHIAARMNNQGWLSVVEPIRKRMYVLADNLKRAGVTIAHTYLMDGRKAGRKVPGRFDRVMLDAPCSGEARIHAREPDSFAFWSERKIREQARKQRGLIVSAFEALRPGGRLLYATCSYAPEENEAIVDHLLTEYASSAELLPVDLPIDHWQAGLTEFDGRLWSQSLQLARRILPEGAHDGFFMALLTKSP